MVSFGLKKWLGALLQPLPFLTLLMLIAIYFQVKGAKKAALITQTAALLVFLLIATPPLSDYIIRITEGELQTFNTNETPEFIVVLGCGHTNNDAISITSQIHNCSLVRVSEGVRLWQRYPNAKLVFSGYGGQQPISNAETNKTLAISLGVPNHQIITEPGAKDTEEEAILMAPLLHNKVFALVTSASHMSRAMVFFQQQDLSPIAAPTGHLYKGNQHPILREYLPDANNIHKTEVATYELLGRLWQWMKS